MIVLEVQKPKNLKRWHEGTKMNISAEKTIRFGLYGENGHQIQAGLPELKGAIWVGSCGMNDRNLPESIQRYSSYDALLSDPEVDIVSICSPMRMLQGIDIKKALLAGKHVYAEKPCVMTVQQLDEIQSLSLQMGVSFFEMADTAFIEPYATAKEIIQSGELGEIVQVSVQKSYPYADWRPQDEAVDGGLIMQSGVHAVRMIEHVAGYKVQAVAAIETGKGNPKSGGLNLAACLCFKLEGDRVAAAAVNYLNQAGSGIWGYEFVRIFGTKAFLETDARANTVRVISAHGERQVSGRDRMPYLQRVVDYLQGKSPRPLPLEIETHPTRVVISAKQSAQMGGKFVEVS